MKILITGHAGFIGNVAWNYFLNKGHELYGIDNLVRKTSKIPPRAGQEQVVEHIKNIALVGFPKVDAIIHLAAQVSVVDGDKDPENDFTTNALGTFNIVQWAKKNCSGPIIYASTNKVFGELVGVNSPILDSQPLIPQTNYGVSKCTGAMYVHDAGGWVLHQSCIYGESQLGDLNQGWVGWIRQSIKKKIDITCFGDGQQVRDLLHVNDLVKCYDMILEGKIKQGSYVCGGGVENAHTFEEVVNMLGGTIASKTDWRSHDQKYFVSANNGLNEQGWKPEIIFKDNIEQLI